MMKQLAAYLTIPFVLGLSPLVGWLVGKWMDERFNSTPIFTLILIFLGLAAGFREVYRIIKRFGNGI